MADEIRTTAERIADALLRNAFGDVAERLVLELPDGRDGGGRCRTSIVQEVGRILKEKAHG